MRNLGAKEINTTMRNIIARVGILLILYLNIIPSTFVWTSARSTDETRLFLSEINLSSPDIPVSQVKKISKVNQDYNSSILIHKSIKCSLQKNSTDFSHHPLTKYRQMFVTFLSSHFTSDM